MSHENKRVGIFGGFFGPIHCGHIATALEILEAMQLDGMLMVTSAQPPHRDTILDAWTRHLMVIRALGDYDNLWPSSLEIKRQGPSFAIDTVLEVQAQYPDAMLVVGPEYLKPGATWNLLNWQRGAELLRLCPIVTHARAGVANLSEVQLWASHFQAAQITVVPSLVPEISSTLVRQKASRGESLDGLVPESIIADVERFFGPGQNSEPLADAS